ncbi:MAG: hypothetical protein OXE59_13125 [Bacteroidetes bacterium]|nr:hypothetical protein [Bacteroidota bacterium]
MSAILDPAAVAKEYLKNDTYRLQVEQFLKGIIENGVLICDNKGVLLDQTLKTIINAAKANTKNKKVEILWNDLIKLKPQKIITAKSGLTLGIDAPVEICSRLESDAPPDVIITSPDNYNNFYHSCHGQTKLIKFDNYLQSEFEKQRNRFFMIKPLQDFQLDQRKKLFSKFLRFTKEIRIYDKHIGHANNLSGFLKGINWILNLWKDDGYFFNANPKLYIYTADHGINANDRNRLKSDLLDELSNNFGALSIKLYLQKLENSSHFHARYLQTNSSILLIERGFNFLKDQTGKTVLDTEIALKPKSASYLDQLRDSSQTNEIMESS